MGTRPGVIAGLAGAPPVTHLGRLLGWDPPPLTVRQARTALRAAGGPPPWAARTDLAGAPAAASAGTRRGGGADPSGIGGPRLAPCWPASTSTCTSGEIVAVLGRNGSGKTSLLRMLAGAHQPSTGSVVIRAGGLRAPGARLPALLVDRAGRGGGHARPCSAGDPSGGALARRPGPARPGRPPPAHLVRGPAPASGVAAVAVGDAPVLVLDEPTRGIDAASARRSGTLLAHRGSGGAVVLATHDVELAARVATRVLVLGDGDVVADGPARHVLAGSLFAPQVLRVLPPFLTVDEVAAACPPVGSRP